MATEADHISLANRNHAVLLHLLTDVDKFPEWVTVAAFYKAVQVVEAAFEHTHGRCCHGHPKRLEMLKSCGYRELHRHYRVLWAASCVARYLYDNHCRTTYSCFSDYLRADEIYDKIIKKRLRSIEDHALRLLSETAKRELLRIPIS